MNERERGQRIRRILVALDGSRQSLAALETAVSLAAEVEAELVGLFVEDINLLRLADLPFAREVRFFSTTTQQLDSRRMQAEMRARATQARRALTAAAKEAEVRASFRVVRGQVTPEVLTAAIEADLLMLGRVSRPLTRRVRLGSTARAAAVKAPRSVLLMRHRVGSAQPMMVTYDGTDWGRRTLETAVRLARSNSPITILLLADSAEEAEALQEETAALLEERNLSAEYRWLERANVQNLARAVETAQCGLMVLGGEKIQLTEQTTQALVDTIDCSIMLVR